MDNIDYEGWAEYVTDRLREYEITDGLVLELGCGTGTMTGLLAGKGYDMIGVESYNNYVEKGAIEVAPLAYMRGRTLDDSFIILDEAQNTTPEQMKMFLTRMGVGSKVVVTGDVTQIDLPDKVRSGLIDALHVLRDVEGIAQVRLTEKDVVRHRLVQQIVKAYEKAAEEKAPGSHNHKQTMEVD